MSINKLLISESPLQILPSLACAIGLNEAILLQQIHYWLVKSKHIHDGRSWIYNSVEEWNAQFPFWSEHTVRRVLSSLEKSGLIVTANYNKDKRDQTKWYSIDYDIVNNLENSDSEALPAELVDEQGNVDNGANCSVLDVANLDTCKLPIWTDAPDQFGRMQTSNLAACIYKEAETTAETTADIKRIPPNPPCRGNVAVFLDQSQDQGQKPTSEPQGQKPTSEPEQPPELDYRAALDIYNDVVGDSLPPAVDLHRKRLRNLKKIISELAQKNLDGFKRYVQLFVNNAPPFYFGDNQRGWTANFDYLLRLETLTKVREGTY